MKLLHNCIAILYSLGDEEIESLAYTAESPITILSWGGYPTESFNKSGQVLGIIKVYKV
jgi:hypothetical protein